MAIIMVMGLKDALKSGADLNQGWEGSFTFPGVARVLKRGTGMSQNMETLGTVCSLVANVHDWDPEGWWSNQL